MIKLQKEMDLFPKLELASGIPGFSTVFFFFSWLFDDFKRAICDETVFANFVQFGNRI